MSKYRINTNPRNSLVPTVELIEGQTGKIQGVGIYPGCSVIHLGEFDHERILYTENSPIRPVAIWGTTPNVLADYTEEQIRLLSEEHEIPLDELTEVWKLEKDLRKSLADDRKPETG